MAEYFKHTDIISHVKEAEEVVRKVIESGGGVIPSATLAKIDNADLLSKQNKQRLDAAEPKIQVNTTKNATQDTEIAALKTRVKTVEDALDDLWLDSSYITFPTKPILENFLKNYKISEKNLFVRQKTGWKQYIYLGTMPKTEFTQFVATKKLQFENSYLRGIYDSYDMRYKAELISKMCESVPIALDSYVNDFIIEIPIMPWKLELIDNSTDPDVAQVYLKISLNIPYTATNVALYLHYDDGATWKRVSTNTQAIRPFTDNSDAFMIIYVDSSDFIKVLDI